MVGPKKDDKEQPGVRYHAIERIVPPDSTEWVFDQTDVVTSRLLVRITIAKIEDRDRLHSVLSSVPIRQGTPGWNCVAWVKEALEMLELDAEALGTRAIGWEKVRDAAMSYCDQKVKARRFDGERTLWPPTFDLMTNNEVIP